MAIDYKAAIALWNKKLSGVFYGSSLKNEWQALIDLQDANDTMPLNCEVKKMLKNEAKMRNNCN